MNREQPLTACAPLPSCCPICHASGDCAGTGVAIAGGQIYRCTACSGFFLFPKVTVDYSGSEWTGRRQERWEEDTQCGCRFAQAIVDKVRQRWGCTVGSVLEIGCGSGFMGKGFESIGCSYTGIDVDAESIAFARGKGLDVHRLPAEQLDSCAISDRRFDLILSSNVLEHVDDPVKVLQNVRILSKGIVVIIVPNANGLFQRMRTSPLLLKLLQLCQRTNREIAYSIDGYWHNIAYSRRTLEHLAEETSLEVIEIETIGTNDETFGFVQPNSSLSYRIASGFASMLGMEAQVMLAARTRT